MPSPEAPLGGSCACGTLRFQVTSEFTTAGFCHCHRCQHRAGVPWSMNGMVDARAVEILAGDASVRYWRPEGGAVLDAARAAGIDFLEVARYNDVTGTAPIRTGYSEVVFGEVFRASGWPRDEVTIANKLWWEFWPEQSPAEELDASLQRS